MPEFRLGPERLRVPFLLALCGACFLYGLGNVGLLGPDEPRYAEVAREMHAAGNLVTPTLLGRPWFEKPILPYWLQILCYRIFGVDEFAARLPSALGATLFVLGLYFAVGRTAGKRVGFVAGVVLATSLFFLAFARAATFDLPLTVCIGAGLLAFHASQVEEGKASRRAALAMHAFFGLAMLAKGLVGIVLPAGVIGLYFVLSDSKIRDLPAVLKKLNVVPGAAVFIVVVGSWYGPVTFIHGEKFIREFFIAHHFQRFTSDRFHHAGPWYFYFPVLLGGLIPWTVPFIKGLWNALPLLKPSRTDNPSDSLKRLCLCWIIVPFVFFSLSGSKLPGYLLPVWPACAVLAALALVDFEESLLKRRVFIPLGLAASLLLLGAAPVVAGRFLPIPSSSAWMTAVPALLGALFLAYGTIKASRYQTRMWAQPLVPCAIAVAVTIILTTHCLFPLLETRESLKPLAMSAVRRRRPGESLAFYGCRKYAPVFYAPELVACCDRDNEPNRFDSPRDLALFFADSPSVLLILPETKIPDLTGEAGFAVEILDAQAAFRLARVEFRSRRPSP